MVSLGPLGVSVTGSRPTVYLPLLDSTIAVNESGYGDYTVVYDPSISATTACSTNPP